jgi:MucB/RseB N-terminal domain
MRHGLLVTAVATVTAPGLLAMLAVIGHEHVAVGAGTTAAAALDGPSLSGRFPVASAQQASGPPVTVLSQVTVGQQVMGTHLLDTAADAGLSTSYQGKELISQAGVDGRVTMVSQVWHQGGGATVVETSSGTGSSGTGSVGTGSAAVPPFASSDVASSDPASGSPEGVFGVTRSLVALLVKHYVVVYRGGGAAVGRSAAVVELYRFDGSLAARYWLDKQTMVPLRRELYGTAGNVISEDSFVQVKFGTLAVPPLATANVAQPRAQAQLAWQPAWVAVSPPTRFLASLAGQGWRVPVTPPDGLPLYAAAWANTASGKVVDLEYSDGLYVVSLFVQRGSLAPDMAGWQPVNLAGQQAFVSGHSVTWAGPGFVYTVIAGAPPQTVKQVVGAVPRSGGSPGVLDRLGRGLIRIARVINPFD